MTTDAPAAEALEHAHEHADGDDHGHSHGPNFGPQPVPMGIAAGLVPMEDGTDRVMVTYQSVNGTWTVFYDRDGAIAHAKTLLEMAHLPPATTPETAPAAPEKDA